VAALADATGVSLAGLARRFNELVGEPPMSFLTGWRIALAAAFKRVREIGPQRHRAARCAGDA